MSAKAERRARKKQNAARARDQRLEEREALLATYIDGVPPALLELYMGFRYVCDGCGLEQPMLHAQGVGDPEHPEVGARQGWWAAEQPVAPCAGPLGLPCGSETAHTLEGYREAA